MEDQLPAGLREAQIAQFIKYDKFYTGEIVGHPSLALLTGLSFKTVYKINGVEEAATGSVADTGKCKRQFAGLWRCDRPDYGEADHAVTR